MNTHCQCCLLMLWARAMCAIVGNQTAVKDVLMQRQRDPRKVQDKDFFKECVWAIYVAGFKAKIVGEKRSELERAFFRWDYKQVCQHKDRVRAAATRVINRPDKADAVIEIAQWMCKEGWAAIRKQLLGSITQDGQGNFIHDHKVLKYLDALPMIGEVSAIYILKNIGYDVAKPDVWLTRLAANFNYPGDKNGVQRFASDISQLVLERVSVAETVLWNAVSSKADLSFQCPCCGRQC